MPMLPAIVSLLFDNLESAAKLNVVLAWHAGADGDDGCLRGCGRPHDPQELHYLPDQCEPSTSFLCPQWIASGPNDH